MADPSAGRIGLLGAHGLGFDAIVIATDLAHPVSPIARRKKNGTARMPARMTWRSMLPDPGSIYASNGMGEQPRVWLKVTPQRRDGYLSRPGVDVTSPTLHVLTADSVGKRAG